MAKLMIINKKGLVFSFVFGVIFFVGGFPFSCLQIEDTENFKMFLESKSAYRQYEEDYSSPPKDLSFLPDDVRLWIEGNDNTSWVQKNNSLEFRFDSPQFYGTNNLIKMALGKNKALAIYLEPSS